MNTPIIVSVLVLAAALGYGLWTFNRFVALRTRSDNAWSDIDVQLKRRWDLVPRLVDAVRGYASHEKATLENAALARAGAQRAGSPGERAEAEAALDDVTGRLLAVAEAYPELKASELFLRLQSDLVDVEDHLQHARRYYNAVVRDYNTMLDQFPPSVVAKLMRFAPREFFGLNDSSESNAPSVAGPAGENE
jgi:LemA protein